MMQEQRDEVLFEFVKHKIGLTSSFSEPEDHIAAELAFAGHLADNNAERKKFIEAHPLKWIKLLEDEFEVLEGGIYKNLATLSRLFMEFDRDILLV